MSEFVQKPGALKINGLGPKAQKLQAMREKAAAQGKGGAKLTPAGGGDVKAKGFGPTKKTSFQRKAV